MRDFSKLAEVLVPQRKLFHISIFVISLLMLPGLMWALTPIDVEAYNLDSPEIEAREVITQEYPGNEIVAGYAIIIRDQTLVGDDPSTKYNNEIADYSGDGMGVSQPKGGILNLSVLQ